MEEIKIIILILVLAALACFLFISLENKKKKKVDEEIEKNIKKTFFKSETEINLLEEEQRVIEKNIKENTGNKKINEESYLNILKSTINLKKSNLILRKQISSLSKINHLARTVIMTEDQEEVLAILLNSFIDLTKAERVCLYAWENNNLKEYFKRGNFHFVGSGYLNDFQSVNLNSFYEYFGKNFTVPNKKKLIPLPLKEYDHNLGVIYLIYPQDKASTSELDIINALSMQVARAIHHHEIQNKLIQNKVIENDLHRAAEIQKKLYPQVEEKLGKVEVAIHTSAAQVVSGDYYDLSYFKKEKLLTFTMADISGKGLATAFLMSQLRTTIKSLDLIVQRPDELLTIINKVVTPDLEDDMFVTMFHGEYDEESNILSYANAGHTPLIRYNNRVNRVEEVTLKGVAIGFLDEYTYEESRVELNQGDILFSYTDGISEAENEERKLYGIEPVKIILKKYAHENPKVIKELILKSLKKYSNKQKPVDDTTFIIIKIGEA